MTTDKHSKLLSSKAYNVFVVELDKYLGQFENLLEADKPADEEIYKASAGFHTIKGGAGFFGLSEVARIAGVLESMLIKEDFNFSEELQTITELFGQLKDETLVIPRQ